jgi:DNA polymerase kappa
VEPPPQASTSKPLETPTLPSFELPSPSCRLPELPGPTSTEQVTVPPVLDTVSHPHVQDERAVPEAQSELAGAPPRSKSPIIAVSECPLCARSFTDNDELNAHIDWCLSREAIRSAQGDGDRSKQRKPKGGIGDLKEWWKAGPAEEGPVTGKVKRRKLKG